MTSYLAAVYKVTPLPRLWAGQIPAVLAETGFDRIADIARRTYPRRPG